MDSILGLGVAFLGLLAVSQVIMLTIVASRLVKMPLWAPLVLPIQRDTVKDALPVLDTARAELERNGFRYIHTRRVRSLVSIAGMPSSFCDVYHHGGDDIHAEVYLATPPTPSRICDIYLGNSFLDGTALLTVNNLAHSLMPYPRNVTVADGNAADLAGHAAVHLKARASFVAARTEASDALAVAQKMAEQLLPRMEQEKLVYRRGERHGHAVYGFGFWAAVKTAWRMRRAAMQMKKETNPATADAPQPLQDLGTARLVAERLGFVRTLCTLRGLRAPRWFKRSVLVFSAVAFLALGSWLWGPAVALVIAAVILVHEAGHWVAMKLARFRDVQVFFVPGLGGATSGEKHEAAPMTHLIVYLAGPVPGLLMGLGAFAWVALGPDHSSAAWHPLLLITVVATFFINAFNMLPVLPLDGGRVVELLLVGRLPWLRFIFAVGSGGLLLAAGLSTGDNVLGAIGIAMLIGAQQHYRVAKASALLLRQSMQTPGAGAQFSVIAKQLFDFLAQPTFQKWNYQTKLTVGLALLPRFLGRVPSWKEAGLGMAVYILCALLPLAGLAGLAVMAPTAVMGALGQGLGSAHRNVGPAKPHTQAEQASPPSMVDLAEQQKAHRAQRNATLAAAQGQAERQIALKEAINDADEAGDRDDALRLARLLDAETRTLGPLDRARVDAAVALVTALYGSNNTAAASTEIASLQLEAEGILRQRLAAKMDREDLILLAQILEQRTPHTDKAAMLAMRQEIVALFVANLEPSDKRLAYARRNLARTLDRVGEQDAAERALRLAAADTALTSDAQMDRQAIQDDLAWMLLAHHKLDEAAQLAQSQAAATQGAEHARAHSQRNAHMVLSMVARLNGDWEGVSRHATAVRNMAAAETPQMGNWFLNLALTRMAPPIVDRRATLLLIDSERKLGHTAAADKLLAEFRKSAGAFETASQTKNICKMHVTDTLWRRELQQTLLDIEQRELQCVVAEGTLIDVGQFD